MKLSTTFTMVLMALAITGCSSTPTKTVDDAPPSQEHVIDHSMMPSQDHKQDHNMHHGLDNGSKPSMTDMPGMAGMSEEEHKKMMSQPAGSSGTDHSGHEGHHDHGAMPSNFGGPYQTMTAIGSGTSLIPADSPAYMWHFNLFEDRARCMVHAELKASFNSQGGPRGVSRFQSQNWLMGSCEVPVFSDSAFQFRAMLTAEPFTTPAGGVPQLFQTGETYGGREIVDAQHPHNLFSEMSVAFTQRLSDHFRYYLYFGLPGDREEGPTAFMHRASALENPGVPLCHHCQDAGHITNGVFSAGVEIDKLRIGASVFRGQEPGEDRYTISAGGFDSYSVRLQYAPTQNWVIGASYGRVHNAEPLHPGDMDRYTLFAQYSKRFDEGYVALSGVLGHNKESHGTLSGALMEGTVNFYDRNYIYGRGECVNKPGLTDSNIYGKPGLEHDEGGAGEEEHHVPLGNSTVCALTAGYARDVYASSLVRVGLGLDVTTYLVPKELEPIYGSSPLSFMFNIRIRPGRVF